MGIFQKRLASPKKYSKAKPKKYWKTERHVKPDKSWELDLGYSYDPGYSQYESRREWNHTLAGFTILVTFMVGTIWLMHLIGRMMAAH